MLTKEQLLNGMGASLFETAAYFCNCCGSTKQPCYDPLGVSAWLDKTPQEEKEIEWYSHTTEHTSFQVDDAAFLNLVFTHDRRPNDESKAALSSFKQFVPGIKQSGATYALTFEQLASAPKLYQCAWTSTQNILTNGALLSAVWPPKYQPAELDLSIKEHLKDCLLMFILREDQARGMTTDQRNDFDMFQQYAGLTTVYESKLFYNRNHGHAADYLRLIIVKV